MPNTSGRRCSSRSGWRPRRQTSTLRLRPTTPPATPRSPSRYTGTFTSLWGRRDIVALGGRLYGLNPTLADPVPTMDRLAVVDADTLRIAGGPGYGSPGERVEYERDARGAIVAIRGGSGSTARPDEAFRASLARRDRIRLGEV